MSNGELGDANLNFNVVVCNIRRNHMISALMYRETKEGEEGYRILNNVKKQLFAKGEIDINGNKTTKFIQKMFLRKTKLMLGKKLEASKLN